jgi:hypothetical protein
MRLIARMIFQREGMPVKVFAVATPHAQIPHKVANDGSFAIRIYKTPAE